MTDCVKRSSIRTAVETLTAMTTLMPRSFHRRSCSRAVSQDPLSERLDQVGVLGHVEEGGGGSIPSRACGQRTSASTAKTSPLRSSSSGWYQATICFSWIAARRSADSASLLGLWWS